ncbi:MAG: CHAD domain-containing protein [Planctomycetaceae bacterium]|nr:CHAD domain-containing protein [Planctomycetaceae bacterium]
MAYRFRRTESVQNGLKRIARKQVQQAIAEMEEPAGDLHEAVHQVRKRFKKMRGLLRLVRPGFPQYAEENAWYRDAGREISRVRDAESMKNTAAKLVSREDSSELREALQALNAALLDRQARITAEAAGLEEQLLRLAADQRDALDRIDSWRVKGQPDSTVMKGLKQTYTRGFDALNLLESEDTTDDADWHEWRKRVKYHWYHTRLLVSVWKPVMTARKKELSRLSDLLGDEHDLSVLRELLAREDGVAGGAGPEKLIRRRMDNRQQQLRQQAVNLGCRVFADRPSVFRRRMKQWWILWRKGL